MGSEILRFENVGKNYGARQVVRDFTVSIAKGEFVTIIGCSGCGKTTILKMINGLVTPDTGNIFVAGKNIRHENLIQLRRNIGYAIQGSGLFPHMTVRDNIAYVPNLLNGRNKEQTSNAVKKWVAILGLEMDLLDRYPETLSGGQQQRVGIARALAASPDIVLMDEPFGAVDAITRGQLQKEIRRIHSETGITILFVTHDIPEALALGTKLMVIEKGKLVQFDAVETVRSFPSTPLLASV